MTNKISAELGDAERAQLLQHIAASKSLLPFLVAFAPSERNGRRNMGQSGVGFVRECLALARQHSEILPGKFELDEFERDVRLMESLEPVYSELTALYQLLSDTRRCLGQEAMGQASIVYDSLKIHSKRNGEYRVLQQRLSDFYKRNKQRGASAAASAGA